MLPYMEKEILQMWLRIWGWRDYSGLSGWVLNVITSVFRRGRHREIWPQEKVMWWWKQALKMKERAFIQVRPLKAEKGKEKDFPSETTARTRLANTLTGTVKLISDSPSRTVKRIDLCCFQPLNSWQFVKQQ